MLWDYSGHRRRHRPTPADESLSPRTRAAACLTHRLPSLLDPRKIVAADIGGLGTRVPN